MKIHGPVTPVAVVVVAIVLRSPILLLGVYLRTATTATTATTTTTTAATTTTTTTTTTSTTATVSYTHLTLPTIYSV